MDVDESPLCLSFYSQCGFAQLLRMSWLSEFEPYKILICIRDVSGRAQKKSEVGTLKSEVENFFKFFQKFLIFVPHWSIFFDFLPQQGKNLLFCPDRGKICIFGLDLFLPEIFIFLVKITRKLYFIYLFYLFTLTWRKTSGENFPNEKSPKKSEVEIPVT
jgi:hypothetical protein